MPGQGPPRENASSAILGARFWARGRNFRRRLQRMAAGMPYGATDSTAPGLVGPFGGLGGREPGRKVGQTFRERGGGFGGKGGPDGLHTCGGHQPKPLAELPPVQLAGVYPP